MIVGIVIGGGREAAIDLAVGGPANVERVVRAVIDTGFDGWLALPPDLVADLALVRTGQQRGVLANGSEILVEVHEAIVLWDGRPREVAVSVIGGKPLIGMALLRGYELTMQVVDGGGVRIAELL